MTTSGIHAPLVNFVIATMSSTANVAIAPDGVEHDVAPPAGFLQPAVVAHHPPLRQRERREHPHRVERDQRVGDAAERDQQRGGRGRQHDDAVGEHQPVAAVRQLARQVAVLGDDRRQAREPVVRGVRGEHQDRGGGELEEHEQRRRCRTRPGPSAPSPSVVARVRLQVVRQDRDAEEQRAEEHAHPHERRRGVLRLGPPERGHAVGDRLDRR